MMSRLDPGSATDPSAKAGAKRESLDFDEDSVGSKSIRMADLESVLCSEALIPGSRANDFAPTNIQESKVHEHHNKKEGPSEMIEETGRILSDRQVTEERDSLEKYPVCLSLCHADGVRDSTSLGLNAASEHNRESSGLCCPSKADKECRPHDTSSVCLGLDLNAADVSAIADDNPFHPFKKLVQMNSVDASECGSTTGPVEESEPLKMWKEMKQNGFLSSSHGCAPMPKQHMRQSKKRKDNEIKKKIEKSRKEQACRFSKIAAPSGLLSRLNPGIINHVRNSRQVHSIIEAIVRSEKLDDQTHNRSTNQPGRGAKDNNDNTKVQNYDYQSAVKQFNLGINKLTGHSSSGQRSEICESAYSDDTLALKLSSVTMASEHAFSASNDDFSANQDNISSLSFKAASVALKWLELLEQDIKGRLSALRRSRKRVKNVIQTELPYLVSTEFSSNQENNPCLGHSSEAASSEKVVVDMHVNRWKTMFSQMDKALYEEGKHLENWLRQVQEMQAHCQKGLKYVSVDGFSNCRPLENPRLDSKEALEQECAVLAAAASIYSTCNLVMTTDNMPISS